MNPSDKLRAYWSKRESDIVLHWPGGHGTKSDGHWLSGIFDQKFIDELRCRGYDPTTIKFSVAPQVGNMRFASHQEVSDASAE